jgi:hypothetical protein
LLSGAAHVDLHAFGGKEYERRVGEFLARHLRTAGERSKAAPSRPQGRG